MLQRFVKATSLALAMNLVIFAVGVRTQWIPPNFTLPNTNAVFTVIPVIMATLIGALGAGLCWFFLKRLRQGKRWYWGISLGVLGVSFLTPLGIQAPTKMVLLLELMHITTALPLILLLPGGLTHER